MTEPVVTFTKSETIGYNTINRPPANSYEIEFIQNLDSAIGSATGDPEIKVAMVRSGSDKLFSACADIEPFAANSSDVNEVTT